MYCVCFRKQETHLVELHVEREVTLPLVVLLVVHHDLVATPQAHLVYRPG